MAKRTQVRRRNIHAAVESELTRRQAPPIESGKPMRSRSAANTINGFQYQFDKSILSIMALNPGEAIHIEGTEDIDLSTEYIQCKYHRALKYTPSTIRKPVVAFLKHYSQNPSTKQYTLYAHFNDTTGFTAITLDGLKSLLSEDLKDISLTDAQLTSFLEVNFRFEHGPSYEAQLISVLDALTKCIGCTDHEAHEYYYKNALHEVIRLSRQQNLADRKITKDEFLIVINKKRELYSLWLCQLSSQESYVHHVRQKLKTNNGLSLSISKFIYIDNATITAMGRPHFYQLCDSILNRFFNVGYSLINALPVTLILDIPLESIIELKAAVLDANYPVNDGYEHVKFQPWYFNRKPVINPGTARGRANDTIGRSSYYLRIITRKTYEANISDIETPDTFITTGTVRDCPLVPRECHRHIHLHSPEFDRATLLLEILADS